MAVVTISREFGSEGNAIGAKVAAALKYHIVCKHEIQHICEQFGVIDFKKVHQPQPPFWSGYDEIREEALEFMIDVVHAFAHYGDVVLMGRCSGAMFKGFTDVLNVRIQAPFDLRVQRIRREHLVAPEQVEQLVREKDAERAKLFQVFQSYQWEQALNFDLVIDTGKIAPDLAAQWIVRAVQAFGEQNGTGTLSTRTLQVDPALYRSVSELFQRIG